MKSRSFELLIYVDDILEKAIEIVKNNESITKCYYIKHNKDKNQKGEEIKEHYHFLIRYKNNVRLSVISTLYDFIPKNHIEMKNNWKASVQYLIHLNNSDKHLYNLNEIVIIKGSMNDLITELAKDKLKNSEVFEKAKKMIITNELTTFSEVREWFKENGKEQVFFDKLISIERLIKGVVLTKEENKEKNMNVILICGASGVGKTAYVKDYAKRTNKSLYEATSKNIFDQYKNEEIVVFNEYKSSFFISISEAEHLQLLDNFNNVNVAARYKNKNISNVESLFLTTSLSKNDVLELYATYYPNSVDEFKRRITLIVEINPKEIIIYSHQNSQFEFLECKRKTNDILKKLEEKKKAKIRKEKELIETL